MKNYSMRNSIDVECDELASYSPRTQRMLVQRGMHTRREADTFLNPSWEHGTHDPFLLKDMERAVLRIVEACKKNEKIALWSDYDMDGIPGAVVLFETLFALNHTNIIHYTPHRNREGFGLNTQGIDALKGEGVRLIITIDCGSTDVEPVAHASRLGIDVILTDHHIPPSQKPDAYAFVNPKQEGCGYSESMLCGAGVAFKLAQALLSHARKNAEDFAVVPFEGWEKWLLDLVGMATIADMVPLRGENRVFAYFGLMVLRKSRRPGLQALLRLARAEQRMMTEDDVAFTIAPRINAASRMGHAKDAFALLQGKDPLHATALAKELERINSERKTLVAVMKREIKRRLEKRDSIDSVIVMGNPDWKPSLLGLVASSLAEEYARPVFLWGREEGRDIKGSCRSDGVCHVHALMERARECFTDFGGHAYSGGFTVLEESVHTLSSVLSKEYEAMKEEVHGEELLEYDEDLDIEDVTFETYEEIARFAPFGEGNPKPVFMFRTCVPESVRQFGKGFEHLEILCKKKNGSTVKAIQFFTDQTTYPSLLLAGTPLTLIGHLEVSHFLGKKELRIRIIDIL